MDKLYDFLLDIHRITRVKEYNIKLKDLDGFLTRLDKTIYFSMVSNFYLQDEKPLVCTWKHIQPFVNDDSEEIKYSLEKLYGTWVHNNEEDFDFNGRLIAMDRKLIRTEAGIEERFIISGFPLRRILFAR